MVTAGQDNKSDGFNKEGIYTALSSISDFVFILDAEGFFVDVKLPGNNFINIKPNEFLNKHYKEVNFSDTFSKILEDRLSGLKNIKQEQSFEFILNNDKQQYTYNGRIARFKFGKEIKYIILANNITNTKKELSDKEKRLKELEQEANFYIKQGDVITNQRAKIQKERDQLALEKAEIAKQKELIESDLNFIMKQGDKIAEQKHKIQKQHDLVQMQKKKIEDSILYAKRIQSAVLPPNRFIQHLLTEHFILYKPRDIVSGDFYWTKQVDDRIFIAAADCTGHGVPGALMSMLGITFLNEIINKNQDIHAFEVLNELRVHIISSLRQTGSYGESRDGLDIALCIINHKSRIMEYAGANNPLYLIRNKELIEVKPDKMPIGIHRRAKESFNNHKIKLEKDDLIYIFSDGYIDQFGGEDGRKFLTTNFKKILIENSSKSLEEQKHILEDKFYSWKGQRKQLDDILVIGFKIAFDKKEANSKHNYDWHGKTILVAEDNDANFMLLKTALEKTNAIIIRAENGKKAVKLYKLNPDIDIVLMDIRMPIMDGIEATSQLKQMNQNLPIIVQTAFTMSAEKEKSFKAGCDDYISKPVNIKELYATIYKYLEK